MFVPNPEPKSVVTDEENDRIIRAELVAMVNDVCPVRDNPGPVNRFPVVEMVWVNRD